MSIKYCENCGKYFTEGDYEERCYESECGVYNDFSSHNYHNVEVCPYCNSDDVDEVDEYDICKELNKKGKR